MNRVSPLRPEGRAVRPAPVLARRGSFASHRPFLIGRAPKGALFPFARGESRREVPRCLRRLPTASLPEGRRFPRNLPPELASCLSAKSSRFSHPRALEVLSSRGAALFPPRFPSPRFRWPDPKERVAMPPLFRRFFRRGTPLATGVSAESTRRRIPSVKRAFRCPGCPVLPLRAGIFSRTTHGAAFPCISGVRTPLGVASCDRVQKPFGISRNRSRGIASDAPAWGPLFPSSHRRSLARWCWFP